MKEIMKWVYKIKFYFDVTNSQISWVVGKGPELMSVIYILEKLGFILVKKEIIIFVLTSFIFFVLFGILWKKAGYYDIEQYVNAEKNPVQKELLKAARNINK